MTTRCTSPLWAAMLTIAAGAVQAQTEIKVARVQPSDEEAAFNSAMAEAFEESHPGTEVVFEYYAGEAYKSKLMTLLQSEARPDIFFSWGGKTLVDQVGAGFTRPIDGLVGDEVLATFPPAAVEAYRVNGDLVGLPVFARAVVLWTNTELTDRAGVDHTAIGTWDEFLEAVGEVKAAGITPIVAGGQDKWPLHFWWSYLLLREGGPGVVAGAMEGDDFESEAFVAAGRDMADLVALDPFQKGFMATTADSASGFFGDGGGAFHLMGDWEYAASKQRSTSGEGVPDKDLAIVTFPVIEDPVMPGGEDAVLGGINGWAVSNTADDAAVEFLTFMLSPENQARAAEAEVYTPIVEGAAENLVNPFYREISGLISDAGHFQVFLDQLLGVSVGSTVNDVSADLAQGTISPEDGAAAIQEAWDFR
ncbi:ABC transporter substrate-binding protein [Palleronia sp. LCG004]|uniref:ABC transporter substrate-binding protein n=1 Tax=Palleronia sp. LCG004 TaxID=3079304 RepID=UPI002943827F|nr:extracellular solute-binding protein [Palleronia sp. LCG004]WOI58162.1 extracellular solute-binding protein [Palleronia sp. LCG004]